MKILYLTGAYPPMRCGVGDYTCKLVDALEQIPGVTPGVLTSVAAATSSSRPDAFFPLMERWNLPSLPRIIRTIKKFRPDIVHLQYPASFGRVVVPNFLPLVCQALGIAVVQTWHEHPIYSQMINALPNDTLVLVDPGYPAAYRHPYRFMVRHKRCINIPIGANIPRAELSSEQRKRIRIDFNSEDYRLIVYFGFAIHQKGIEDLLRAADPATDRIVLMCELDPKDPYQAKIIALSESQKWQGNCFCTGYLEDSAAASILAAADAAVFPFVDGATARNGSILAARLQGTFVVTTHAHFRGYNAAEHTFYLAPGNRDGIREALELHAGERYAGDPFVAGWHDIALRHFKLYESILAARYGKRETGPDTSQRTGTCGRRQGGRR
jgi:glycosyltransferase involved in cell wall biosynthesis